MNIEQAKEIVISTIYNALEGKVVISKEMQLIGGDSLLDSMKLVEETIEKEKPDIIGVELDKERLEQLLSGRKWEQTNIIDVIKTGKTYLFLLNILLSNLQKQLICWII